MDNYDAARALLDARQEQATAFRALADDIENGRMPLPGPVHIYVTWMMEVATTWDSDGEPAPYVTYGQAVTEADARKAMDSSHGGWTKLVDESGARYSKAYGDALQYDLFVSRYTTCKRIQVGTRHVEAYDEPVYEWSCPDAEQFERDIVSGD